MQELQASTADASAHACAWAACCCSHLHCYMHAWAWAACCMHACAHRRAWKLLPCAHPACCWPAHCCQQRLVCCPQQQSCSTCSVSALATLRGCPLLASPLLNPCSTCCSLLQAMERFRVPFFAMNLSVGLSVQLQGFGLQVASGERGWCCGASAREHNGAAELHACFAAASLPLSMCHSSNAPLPLRLDGTLQGCWERCRLAASASWAPAGVLLQRCCGRRTSTLLRWLCLQPAAGCRLGCSSPRLSSAHRPTAPSPTPSPCPCAAWKMHARHGRRAQTPFS